MRCPPECVRDAALREEARQRRLKDYAEIARRYKKSVERSEFPNIPTMTEFLDRPPGASEIDSVILSALQQRTDLLRQTADQLQRGEINQWHAANLIRKIANEIAKEEK